MIKVLESYDLAICKCYPNEVILRIEGYLVKYQSSLHSVLKRYMQGEYFDIELDYLYFLLEKFNSETINAIKDDWISMINQLDIRNDYLNDAIEILKRNNAITAEELRYLEDKSENQDKRTVRLSEGKFVPNEKNV